MKWKDEKWTGGQEEEDEDDDNDDDDDDEDDDDNGDGDVDETILVVFVRLLIVWSHDFNSKLSTE